MDHQSGDDAGRVDCTAGSTAAWLGLGLGKKGLGVIFPSQRNFSRLGANAATVSSNMPGGNPKFNALNGLAQQFSVDNSDKDVEIAQQRLERAKARINHSEWP